MTLRATQSVPTGFVQQVLFVIRAADMTLATDQAFTRLMLGTNYVVTNIIGVRKTGAFGIACAGGIYTGAAKAGTVILAAAQTWAALTGAGTIQVATLANIQAAVSASATPNLSLTTGNTGALTADIFILGVSLD